MERLTRRRVARAYFAGRRATTLDACPFNPVGTVVEAALAKAWLRGFRSRH